MQIGTRISIAVAILATSAIGQVEFGKVSWSHELDAVLEQKPRKPLFLLFQEVPG